MVRLLTLTFGPIVIVGLAYLAAQPGGRAPAASPVTTDSFTPPSGPTPERSEEPSLLAACQRKRESLIKRLGSKFFSIVHTPFVVIGDLPISELEREYRETIAPTQRALAIAYFDKSPSEPIAIVLLSGDETYQHCAERLDGQTRASFAGYYERKDRRIVVNSKTGDGTIAHELTHALAHFDFPDMPEWFDEGLASLHEEARFSDDGLRIVGLSNWRIRYLIPAIQKGNLRPLDSLVRQTRIRRDEQALDYAHARFFCLFLQERGLLEPFYRKFRVAGPGDPSGAGTLTALFATSDLATVDGDFRAWAVTLDRANAKPAKTRSGEAGRDQRSRKSNREPSAREGRASLRRPFAVSAAR